MKKYNYNLFGKKGCYTLEEIASTLNVSVDFLEDTLEECNDDIDIACMKGYSETSTKKSISSSLDLYTTKYLCSKNLKDILKDELELRNKKRKLLNTLSYSLKQDDKYCIFLDRDVFYMLLVNTDDYKNNEVIDRDSLMSFKAMENFLNKEEKGFFKLDINGETEIYIDTFNSEDYDDLEKGKLPRTDNNESNNDTLNISVKDLRKIVNYLSTHKLPIVYNTHITSELSNRMNDKVLKYVKQ